MQLVETHAHLDDAKFDADRGQVIRRALEAGVTAMVTVGADLQSSRAAIALSERYPNVYATVGVHPHDARSLTPSLLQELWHLAAHPRVVAIGETGLDFYRDLSPRDAQRAALRSQLELATELGKPVIVHIRDQRERTGAYDEALDMLRDWVSWSSRHWPLADGQPRCRGVLHCFSGDLVAAQASLELGFDIGVDGPVTYPNARALQAMIAQLPLEHLLLETDCPYLSPQAQRGRRNEPAYLPYIAHKVAELKDMDVGAVAEVTSASAKRLFFHCGQRA